MFFLFVLVMGCPVVGQLTKKQLTEADYASWHQLSLQQVSPDGKWVQYAFTYHDTDTIVVKNTGDNRKYILGNARQTRFFNDHYFSFMADKALTVVDLKNGGKQVYKNVKRYEIIGSFLAVHGLDKTLSLYSMGGKLVMKEDQVIDFSVPVKGLQLAFFTYNEAGNALKIFDCSSQKVTIQDKCDTAFIGLKWKTEGTTLFFIKNKNGTTEFHCVTTGTDHILSLPELQNNMAVAADMPIIFSADGKSIFYHVREKNVKEQASFVQIWNSKDRWLYSKDQEVLGYHGVPLLAMWDVEKGKAKILGSLEQPNTLLNADQNYAVGYHPEADPGSFHFPKEQDLFLTNLNDGSFRLWIPQFSGTGGDLQFSPDGRFAAYLKEERWLVYEFKSQATYETTKLIRSNLVNAADILAAKDAFGIAGWSSDGKSLILYDAADVWLVAVDGSNAKRLTNGKETGIVYRIAPRNAAERAQYQEKSYVGGSFDLKKGFFLEGVSTDFGHSLLAFWDGKKVKLIYNTDKKLRNIKVVDDGFILSEESQSISPRILKVNQNGKVVIIAESNTRQKQFEWGKMEVLTYIGSKGNALHGLLYYPAHYDASQKYPMIVNVYEKIIQQRQLYINPSLYNSTGINRTNLCAKGYFVLLPDIEYEASGGIANHAWVCVSAAIEQALINGSIDKKKIGLAGHSFGGYETDLLITQTPLFACAIAGAAVTDMVSSYLLEAKNQKVPNYFRNEAYQFRMGATLWDARESYLLNSPVYNADKIKTPLLSWTGSLDGQVHSSQSTELYFALRRLGKDNIMLVYPEEEHAIDSADTDADLTRKSEQWFGYYLKDEPLPDWMKPR